MFLILFFSFGKLAHANKKRGDGQKDAIFMILDHFYSLCDYILNFHFMDIANPNPKTSVKEATVAWRTLFPFAEALLPKLKSHGLLSLYGLCSRLVSLVRYYVFNRAVTISRTAIMNLTSDDNLKNPEEACKLSRDILDEHTKAEQWYQSSEKYFSLTQFMEDYPKTYEDVCASGDLSAGIHVGGEAGTTIGPIFPFSPYFPLHHVAIVSKCIIQEYIASNQVAYTPISKDQLE
jgi:hypothetical protein